MRSEIVLKAREYINTPFIHQGRLKGVGIDCIGLVINVGKELGIFDESLNIGGYLPIPDGTSFLKGADTYLVKQTKEEMLPGDTIIVKYDKDPQHIGILADYRHGGLSIIHASSEACRVIETRLMFSEHTRFVATYRFPYIQR